MYRKFVGLDYLNSLALWNGKKRVGLENIQGVLAGLGNPQDITPAVIVGGTNGKGSVSAGIAAVLGASGYRVGLNISPHLSRLTERILIDGFEVTLEEVNEASIEVKRVADKERLVLGFHEAITATAMLIFSIQKLDWVVYEVGVGGRLDACNTVRNPQLVSITTVDYDHQQILGNTISEIAFEKAGIIKTSCTVVVGNLPSEAALVMESQAKLVNARLVSLGREFFIRSHLDDCRVQLESGLEVSLQSSLRGEYQVHNLAIVSQVGSLLGVSSDDIESGLGNVFWPGRLEQVEFQGREVILDCAHNFAGMKALREHLDNSMEGKIDLALGFLEGRDWRQMLDLVLPLANEVYCMSPCSERAIDSKLIASYISRNEVRCLDFGSDFDRFLGELDYSSDIPLVICGSIYLVGAIRERLGIGMRPIWQRLQNKCKSINL